MVTNTASLSFDPGWLTNLFCLAVETAAQRAHSPRGIQEKRSHVPWAITRGGGVPEVLISLVHSTGLTPKPAEFHEANVSRAERGRCLRLPSGESPVWTLIWPALLRCAGNGVLWVWYLRASACLYCVLGATIKAREHIHPKAGRGSINFNGRLCTRELKFQIARLSSLGKEASLNFSDDLGTLYARRIQQAHLPR